MVILINVIIIPSSFFMTYFMHDKSLIVNHKLRLYRVFLFLSRIIFLLSFFLSLSTGRGISVVLLNRQKQQESLEVCFDFLCWCFQPFSYVVYLLRNR